jgi:hypothetical protein
VDLKLLYVCIFYEISLLNGKDSNGKHVQFFVSQAANTFGNERTNEINIKLLVPKYIDLKW